MRVAHIRSAAVLLAALVMVTSYAWLAIAHGTFWLGDVVVHENGRLTLGGTVGYFEHFIREWPVDILIALGLAAIVRPVVARTAGSRRVAVLATLGALLLPIAALTIAIQRTGWELVRHDLLQSVTRDGVFVWGSHWHSHWLPMVCIALVATALTRRSLLTVSAWAWLGVLTMVFGIGTATFTSPQFVGHQLRELVTEVGVMAPFAIGTALAGVDGARRVGLGGLRSTDYHSDEYRWRTLVALGAAAIIALALGLLTLTLGSTNAIQPGAGWSAVIAAHVFEHSLDYAWVALLTTAAVAWGAARRS